MRIHLIAVVFAFVGIGFATGVKAQTTSETDKEQSTADAAVDSLDAGSAGAASQPGGQASSQSLSQQGGFFHDWLSMVTETQSEQPFWLAPLNTTSPRLEQLYRYDVQTQPHNNGLVTNNFGGSKGLEIIPAKRWQITLALPPYIENNPSSPKNGFGDWQFLIKYRIIARNEEQGNFILTAFFQSTLPTGQYKQGNPDAVITPTIAYGKGFRDFDIQGTLGVTLPTGNAQQIGRTIPWNNTLQYHLWKLWPELETNFTRYYLGPHGGNTSVYLTPGIVLGKFRIHNRFSFVIGGGYEIAVTSFHPTNHIAIASVRFPF